MKVRIIIIATLTLLIQGTFSLIGFLIGLMVVGLYLGYQRAWEINTTVSLPKYIEDEDG